MAGSRHRPLVQTRRSRFVLISAPRSGTNYLLSLIGQHPHTRCFYELFHEAASKRSEFFGETYRDDDDGGAFVSRVYGWGYPRSVRAIGFKLFYQHAGRGRARTVWHYLASHPEIKVIDLVRENHLETYVSHQVAMKTNTWARYRDSPSETAGCPPFDVRADDFETYVRDMRELRLQALSRVPNNAKLPVSYEDISNRRSDVMKRVFRFLGLPCYPWVWLLKNSLVKQQRVPLAVQVSNYAELRKHFAGSEFSYLF